MRASGIPTNSTACCAAIASGSAVGIGKSYIFTGENYDAARDETKIFAGVQHFREPVNRAFLVGRAHALDERADCIVMRVARAVVDNRFLLDALFGDCDREMDDVRLYRLRSVAARRAAW